MSINENMNTFAQWLGDVIQNLENLVSTNTTNVNNAVSTATSANTAANNAVSTANSAQSGLQTLQIDVSGIDTRLATVENSTVLVTRTVYPDVSSLQSAKADWEQNGPTPENGTVFKVGDRQWELHGNDLFEIPTNVFEYPEVNQNPLDVLNVRYYGNEVNGGVDLPTYNEFDNKYPNRIRIGNGEVTSSAPHRVDFPDRMNDCFVVNVQVDGLPAPGAQITSHVSDKSGTGFVVRLYNNSGALTTGKFSYIAIGT